MEPSPAADFHSEWQMQEVPSEIWDKRNAKKLAMEMTLKGEMKPYKLATPASGQKHCIIEQFYTDTFRDFFFF